MGTGARLAGFWCQMPARQSLLTWQSCRTVTAAWLTVTAVTAVIMAPWAMWCRAGVQMLAWVAAVCQGLAAMHMTGV
jgi:hypothetical protein